MGKLNNDGKKWVQEKNGDVSWNRGANQQWMDLSGNWQQKFGFEHIWGNKRGSWAVKTMKTWKSPGIPRRTNLTFFIRWLWRLWHVPQWKMPLVHSPCPSPVDLSNIHHLWRETRNLLLKIPYFSIFTSQILKKIVHIWWTIFGDDLNFSWPMHLRKPFPSHLNLSKQRRTRVRHRRGWRGGDCIHLPDGQKVHPCQQGNPVHFLNKVYPSSGSQTINN